MEQVAIKSPLQSLTLWVNFIAAVAGLLTYTVTDLMTAYPDGGPMFYFLLGLAIVNMLVRFFHTRQPISESAATKAMTGEVVAVETVPETLEKRISRTF